MSRWEPWEDDIIREFYPVEGPDVCERIPHRTRGACQARASLLGVKASVILGRWTKEDDDILREFYPTEGSLVCARLKNRSPEACNVRAGIIGVKFGRQRQAAGRKRN